MYYFFEVEGMLLWIVEYIVFDEVDWFFEMGFVE